MIFYRIVRTVPPTRADFLSYQELGKRPLRSDPETRRLWAGISVNESKAQAQRRALDLPHLGAYISAIDIAEDGTIQYQRTGRGHGHYTVWGEADRLLPSVIETEPAAGW